jgi:sugar phosphate isomerase/epimerase
MRQLSLHHILAPELSASELVQLAGRLGCRHVCLFTHLPGGAFKFPVVDEASLPELRQVMAENEVTAYGITSFAIAPNIDISEYEPALERGAQLGAQYASVRIVDEDESRAADMFGRLGEVAARYGLTPSIEFIGYKTPEILPKTLRIIEAAGTGTLTIDPLHIVRTGISLDLMRQAGPTRIGYVQLCDGPLEASAEMYGHEAAAERLSPGEGEFPLSEILALAPPGRAVSLEVPNERLRAAGVSAAQRAERAVTGARKLL